MMKKNLLVRSTEADAPHLFTMTPHFETAARTPRLHLEFRPGFDGKPALYFPFRSTSDVHFGSRQSRAKRFCQMMEHTICDYEVAAGDIIDGQAMTNKDHYNLGPYHRQGIAHYLRARPVVLLGNHEHGLESSDGTVRYVDGVEVYEPRVPGTSHRNLIGKTIFGLRFEEKIRFTDPNGEIVEEEHGHKHDLALFKTIEKREQAYSVGNFLLDMACSIDELIQKRWNKEDFSIAGWIKPRFKEIINSKLGIRKAMAADLDAQAGVARRIYGHSHTKGFQVTPGGKTLMNDGSSTDHVESLVCDRYGTWAVMTWHKDRLDILLETDEEYSEYFGDIGRRHGVDVRHFSEPPKLIEDTYTARADRLIRLAYRQWPPKDRKKIRESMTQKKAFMNGIENAMLNGEEIPYIFYKHYLKTATQIATYHATPIPRRRGAAGNAFIQAQQPLPDSANSLDDAVTIEDDPVFQGTWSQDSLYELTLP